MVVNPAAGPLTLSEESLNEATTMPPTTPAMIPEKRGAPDANATPKHNGSATRNTTIPDGRSLFQLFNKDCEDLLILRLNREFRYRKNVT
jgi:hypothetical protein